MMALKQLYPVNPKFLDKANSTFNFKWKTWHLHCSRLQPVPPPMPTVPPPMPTLSRRCPPSAQTRCHLRNSIRSTCRQSCRRWRHPWADRATGCGSNPVLALCAAILLALGLHFRLDLSVLYLPLNCEYAAMLSLMMTFLGYHYC